MPRELTNKQKRRAWEIDNASQEYRDVRRVIADGVSCEQDYVYYSNRLRAIVSRVARLRESYRHEDTPRHYAYPSELSRERIVDEIADIHEATWDNYAEFFDASAAGDHTRKQACADEHIRMGDRRYALEQELASRFSPSESAI